MGATVLFVEDDERIRLTLTLNLTDDGFTVIEAATGEAGVALALSDDPIDIAIVDLGLPGIHGFDVVRAIRAQDTMPIVILTARSDSYDVIAGLEAGADDFITKPVVPKVLAARLRALIRRSTITKAIGTAAATEPVEFSAGPLIVSPRAGVAYWHGDPIGVTKTEFKILCELASHPGEVITREELLERVWGYDYLGDMRLVDTQMYRLRAKLEDDPSQPRYLLTVRGMGYKFVP